MKVTIPGFELNRMMKTLAKCVDKRSQNFSNVEFIWEDTELKIRGTNGQQFCEMRMPMLGGNGERFSLDAGMVEKIAGNAGNRNVEIKVDGNACVIRANGLVRTGAMKTEIQKPDAPGEDMSIAFDGEKFKGVYRKVADAVATDETRRELTGVLMTWADGVLNMTALDGFQLAKYSMYGCRTEREVKVVVPKVVLDLAVSGIGDEPVRMMTNGTRVHFLTDGMEIIGSTLNGSYPDVDKLIPDEANTLVRVSVDEMKNALKGCKDIGNGNLVKLVIGQDSIVVKGNSDEAEYEAEIACDMNGQPLKIAFNDRYLSNVLNAAEEDKVELRFQSSVRPMITKVTNEEYSGMRMLLPVRVNE